MGKKLDLSGLSEQEAEHVLDVVHRDMKLRKKEEERLSEMRQELDEEGSRCSLLSKQELFNDRCCMRCCSPFTLLLKRKRPCGDCGYNVCRGCSSYNKEEDAWLCSTCNKNRLLRTQSLEWYYCNVRRRFKRFGGAKVLKTLYRKFTADQHSLSELAVGSVYEESMGTEGSISDSTFYRQTEEHNISETLHVALRVAEEAVEEAIARAEEHGDSLEKQDEAHYLRQNKEELIEELATSIVQKIMLRRRKLELPPQESEVASSPPSVSQQNTLPSQARLKASSSLRRSRSAFSLTSAGEEVVDGDSVPDSWVRMAIRDYSSLKKHTGGPLASWKSVDQLDNSSMSSVLQSPDGNWIALQSSQRPRLLTKCKSLVFSALERESGAVSAYDEVGSGSEGDTARETDTRMKMSQPEAEMAEVREPPPSPAAPAPPRPEPDVPTQATFPKSGRQLLSSLRRKVQQRVPRPQEPESEQGERGRRLRRRRKSRRDTAEQPETSSSAPEYGNFLFNAIRRKTKKCESSPPAPATENLDTVSPDTLPSSAALPATAKPEPRTEVQEDLLKRELNTDLGAQAGAKTSSFKTGSEEKTASTKRDTRAVRATEKDSPRTAERRVIQEKVEATEKKTSTGHQGQEKQERSVVNGATTKAERLIHSERTKDAKAEQKLEVKMRIEVEEEGLQKTEQDRQVGVQELKGQTEKKKAVTSLTGVLGEASKESRSLMDAGRVEDVERRSQADLEDQRPQVTDGERHFGAELDILPKLDDDKQEDMDTGEQETDIHEEFEMEWLEELMDERTFELESEEDEDAGIEGQIDEEAGRELYLEEKTEIPAETSRERQGEVESERLLKEKYRRPFDEETERLSEMEDDEGWFEAQRQIEVEAKRLRRSPEESQHEELQEEGLAVPEDLEENVNEREKKYSGKITVKPLAARKMGWPNEQEEKGVGILEVGRIRHLSGRERLGRKADRPAGEEMRTKQGAVEENPLALDMIGAEDIRKKYSAASLCSITTEVLRVLNATEDLIEEVEGKARSPDTPTSPATSREAAPVSHADSRLDEQLLTLEENVYLAAGAVFKLEGELRELEECARDIGSATTDAELAHLEEQVATAAAQVQQSDLQVSGIAARISALKSAGLKVAHKMQQPVARSQPRTVPRLPHTVTFTGRSGIAPSQTQTIDSSRQHRRKLPTPPQ